MTSMFSGGTESRMYNGTCAGTGWSPAKKVVSDFTARLTETATTASAPTAPSRMMLFRFMRVFLTSLTG